MLVAVNANTCVLCANAAIRVSDLRGLSVCYLGTGSQFVRFGACAGSFCRAFALHLLQSANQPGQRWFGNVWARLRSFAGGRRGLCITLFFSHHAVPYSYRSVLLNRWHACPRVAGDDLLDTRVRSL